MCVSVCMCACVCESVYVYTSQLIVCSNLFDIYRSLMYVCMRVCAHAFVRVHVSECVCV